MMAAARWRHGKFGAPLAAALLLLSAGAWRLADRNGESQSSVAAPQQKPALMLLTTLPLVFPEKFTLEGGSPALDALERRYRVIPISTTAASELRTAPLLLMAHPLAQPAESLVDLDSWVRGGGKVLILADPALEWDSERPLGDPLRPPPSFADTGLLAHWGLRLDAPDERGPRQLPIGSSSVLTVSPGTLSGRCAIGERGLVARCRIGKGAATIVADADFLDVGRLDGPTDANLSALIQELESLRLS